MIVINVAYRIEGCMFLKCLLGYQLRSVSIDSVVTWIDLLSMHRVF
jgi:hypothetical protein